MSDLQPARATFYGSFEGRYGAETARVNPVTDQAFAETGVTIAVDPNVIPYEHLEEDCRSANKSASKRS